MATLSVDKFRVFENTGGHPDYNEIPMIATDIIYGGAAVGESSSAGTARPLVGGDNFLGFCDERADNSTGAASAINVKVKHRGVVKLSVTGVSSTAQVGDTVYASDDDTFTLTASGGSSIGKVKRWITGAICLVAFEATPVRSL